MKALFIIFCAESLSLRRACNNSLRAADECIGGEGWGTLSISSGHAAQCQRGIAEEVLILNMTYVTQDVNVFFLIFPVESIT